jgi:hypothetical protein
MSDIPVWVKDLTSDSIRQVHWVIEKSPDDLKPVRPSDGSEEWLTSIFTHLANAKVPKYSRTTIDGGKTEIDAVLKLFKKSDFIDDVFSQAVSSSPTLVKTSYIRDDKSAVINVITSPEWPEVSKQIIDSIMVCTAELQKIFPWANPPLVTNILLIPTPILKTYAVEGKWEPLNINTGYSDHGIVIWRRQEILKVAIHELLHLYGIELSTEYFQNSDKFKRIEDNATPTQNMNNEPRWNEGATEALATILHISILCRIHKLDLSNFYLQLQFEKTHARLMGTTLYTIYSVNESQESTSVFSYFIVKSLLLDNLELFRKLLEGRSYEQFMVKIKTLIAQWVPPTGIDRAPFLRMSALGI